METNQAKDQKVDINFESHPPIEDDVNGVATLLKQSLLQFVDCHALSSHLISLKDITQVIAQESPEEENTNEEDGYEADDDIYGIVSVLDIPKPGRDGSCKDASSKSEKHILQILSQFLCSKCTKLKGQLEDESFKFGMIVNERYINLPPQLSVPTFKALEQYLEESKFTHLIFISKILLKARSSETKLPSKRTKSSTSSKQSDQSSQDDSLVYINAEEEIIFENCDHHVDFDVSAFCDENATWSFGSDIKYIPHRRIMIVDYKKWSKIMKDLEEELCKP